MDTRPPAPAERPGAGAGPEGDEPPPFLGRWSALYAAVIGELVLVIAFCHWLSTRGR
jgi:hypothetical protein